MRLSRIASSNPFKMFFAVLAVCALVFAGGCSRLRPKPPAEYVYVNTKPTFLRERVAAVSARVGIVQNGQRLEVLDHGRRFLKVKTEKSEIGWIEDRAVISQADYDVFQDLKKAHAKDPVVATAVLRDDLYLHMKPGRETQHFYLLPENEKLQLLVRASVVKPQTNLGPMPKPSPAPQPRTDAGKTAAGKNAAKTSKADARTNDKPPAPAPAAAPPSTADGEPPPMEDWWLIRDSKGDVGWLLARGLDVDVPDEIAGYSEGQKMVGAYVLTMVDDPESNFTDKRAPEYVSVLNAFKNGLPYDFDQVRVFTWNTKKHHYETAFRQRNLQGYLPVTVTRQTLDAAGPVPVFSFKTAAPGSSITIDPATGASRPTQTDTQTYRMDGVIVKRVGVAPPKPPKAATTDANSQAKSAAARKRSMKKKK